jgi:hypothetical protein
MISFLFSDNSSQTDLKMVPQKKLFHFTREISDLPSQVPNYLLQNLKQNKKNVRIRSLEDHQRQQHSHSNQSIHDDSIPSHRSNYGAPFDLRYRPLWNYQNPEHREYIPNSKRDPFYEKRQRSQGNINRSNDRQKKTTYNRWNSDSEIQHERKDRKINTTNRTRSTGTKYNNQKDESFSNLVKEQKPKPDAFVITNTDEQSNFNNISSLDKYEHFTPYIRTDEILDPAKAFSPVPQSREASAHKQRVRACICKEIFVIFCFL